KNPFLFTYFPFILYTFLPVPTNQPDLLHVQSKGGRPLSLDRSAYPVHPVFSLRLLLQLSTDRFPGDYIPDRQPTYPHGGTHQESPGLLPSVVTFPPG